MEQNSRTLFVYICDYLENKFNFSDFREDHYCTIVQLIHADKKVDAIKYLRALTEYYYAVYFNFNSVSQRTPFENFLLEKDYISVHKRNIMGLKAAKDVIDFMFANKDTL